MNLWILLPVLILKLILLFAFSSDWLDTLFIPFTLDYLTHGGDPWATQFTDFNINPFPYPPGMLYLHTLSLWPLHIIGLSDQDWLLRICYKLPTVVADLLIVYVLQRLFPTRLKEIIIFYVASPIVFFAAYTHSQLDLIPTSLLLASAWFLVSNRIFFSAIWFGMALCTKTHVVAALPLFLIWLLRKRYFYEFFLFLLLPALLFFLICLPYQINPEFRQMVLNNQEQLLVFSFTAKIGEPLLLFAPLACFIIYLRFLAYYRMNRDLFFAFLGLLFSVFVLCVPPMPGWYLWLVPYTSIFFIQIFERRRGIIYLYLILSLTYLVYFVFCHQYPIARLNFLGEQLVLPSLSGEYTNLGFTLLWASLFLVIASAYMLGVRSNLVYRQRSVGIALGIGGDSGVGKTTLLQDLKSLFGSRLLDLEGDADHRWERGDESWANFTHLDPKANYLHRQAEDILTLKRGKSITRTEYDHSTGKFTKPRLVKATDFIVLSGLHPFYLPKMRKLLDLKVYLDTDENLRRHWKILRDTQTRGYSLERILRQIEERKSDTNKYIYPQKSYADLIVHYFSQTQFEAGSPDEEITLGLKVSFSASINTENLISLLRFYECQFSWDYSNDLHNQEIVFLKPVSSQILMQLATRLIFGLEELLEDMVSLTDGYRGLVQLLVLLLLSEKTRVLLGEEEEHQSITL